MRCNNIGSMPPNAVYVGRGSKWGNPFTFANSGDVHPAIRFACEVAPMLDVSELVGKDLACWCRLDQMCHADSLLEMAAYVAPAISDVHEQAPPQDEPSEVTVRRMRDEEWRK